MPINRQASRWGWERWKTGPRYRALTAFTLGALPITQSLMAVTSCASALLLISQLGHQGHEMKSSWFIWQVDKMTVLFFNNFQCIFFQLPFDVLSSKSWCTHHQWYHGLHSASAIENGSALEIHLPLFPHSLLAYNWPHLVGFLCFAQLKHTSICQRFGLSSNHSSSHSSTA